MVGIAERAELAGGSLTTHTLTRTSGQVWELAVDIPVVETESKTTKERR